MTRTDHRSLVRLFKKPLLSIENEDLRDLVAQLSQYSFSVEDVPGPSNEFRGWLSRNCVGEIYNYQDHRMSDEKTIEELHEGNWKKFVPVQHRRSSVWKIVVQAFGFLVGTFRCSSAGWKIHGQVFEPRYQEDCFIYLNDLRTYKRPDTQEYENGGLLILRARGFLLSQISTLRTILRETSQTLERTGRSLLTYLTLLI